MTPGVDDQHECGGAFNPAVARSPNGDLYLFPRLVGSDGLSRIGRCRVRFDDAGDPVGVERLGIALAPEADYELSPGGGCEDPRIVFFEPLACFIMTYTAVGPVGPRVALALSHDLKRWERLGLAHFELEPDVDITVCPNKNAIIFPEAVIDPDGVAALAMIHRPLVNGAGLDLLGAVVKSPEVEIPRDDLWISFSRFQPSNSVTALPAFRNHHRVSLPGLAWNRRRIGGGTPPLKLPQGYLVIYHGVADVMIGFDGSARRRLVYSAGAFVLDERDPRRVVYHTEDPILAPLVPEEVDGFMPRVVFPTGVDRRTDIGQPGRIDLYYGMADSCVGVARLDIPDYE
jgi:predicted GH43/DUF377 family glycosyl hydrolase